MIQAGKGALYFCVDGGGSRSRDRFVDTEQTVFARRRKVHAIDLVNGWPNARPETGLFVGYTTGWAGLGQQSQRAALNQLREIATEGKTMKAYVISEPGGPGKLVLTNVDTPEVKPGWVLIKVRAFGLNRSEWFTRLGESPSVKFPRVLGIECVGEVADSLNPKFKKGQKVAAIMGGMGRDFDGSYEEYVLAPEKIVFAVQTQLDWKVFGALPEMVQTTHGSLYQGLEIEKGQSLLIRGGTSSIGLCALEMAKNAGLKVISTTRSEAKMGSLKRLGASDVIVDKGEIANEMRKKYPEGVDRVLELVHCYIDC